MNSVDLVCVWPVGFDYPPFRKLIRENRKRFRRVVIVWTNNHNGKDLRVEIEEKMKKDDIAFMESPYHDGNTDWRSTALRHALGYSDSDWILFIEQDFFPKKGFWEWVEFYFNPPSPDMMVVDVQGRFHPCCWFIRRAALDETCKDFSPDYPGDHFSRIQKDVEEQGFQYTIIPPKLYTHLNGLSHNLFLHQRGEKITYKPKAFFKYLKEAKEIATELDA